MEFAKEYYEATTVVIVTSSDQIVSKFCELANFKIFKTFSNYKPFEQE